MCYGCYRHNQGIAYYLSGQDNHGWPVLFAFVPASSGLFSPKIGVSQYEARFDALWQLHI